jgi:hypothetical protein
VLLVMPTRRRRRIVLNTRMCTIAKRIAPFIHTGAAMMIYTPALSVEFLVGERHRLGGRVHVRIRTALMIRRTPYSWRPHLPVPSLPQVTGFVEPT